MICPYCEGKSTTLLMSAYHCEKCNKVFTVAESRMASKVIELRQQVRKLRKMVTKA